MSDIKPSVMRFEKSYPDPDDNDTKIAVSYDDRVKDGLKVTIGTESDYIYVDKNDIEWLIRTLREIPQ